VRLNIGSQDQYILVSPTSAFTETIDGVTYHGHWFIDNQVVVLYVGSVRPLTMMLGTSPEITAQQIFHEFLADEAIRRRVQPPTGTDPQPGKTRVE